MLRRIFAALLLSLGADVSLGDSGMLSLPQANGSQIRIPSAPNYRRALEAFGFHVARQESTSLLMVRHCPDENGYDGAWQYRATMPAAFAAQVQRAIQVVE
jgi:hypothetical protein